MKVIFLHGKESGPWGSKIKALAPALYTPQYNVQSYSDITNTEIIHGWSDNIIPVEHSIKYAQQAQCTLHLIDGDHRLNSSLNQVTSLFTDFLQGIVHVNKNILKSVKYNK